MITILSPAKTLNFNTPSPIPQSSPPLFIEKASQLIQILKRLTPADIMSLMKISNGISELNFIRYTKWELNHTTANSKQAVFAYNGEVFNGFRATKLEQSQANYAQEHLRIISGLYGILRPLDLIQPYRLEMCTKIAPIGKKDLFDFWTDTITSELNKELMKQKSKVIVNLASKEYSKVIHANKIKGKLIQPIFKELKGIDLKTIVVYTKKARGLMARFIIDNKIESPEDLKYFDMEGYFFNERESDATNWLFTR
jgi:uncharacterized protein